MKNVPAIQPLVRALNTTASTRTKVDFTDETEHRDKEISGAILGSTSENCARQVRPTGASGRLSIAARNGLSWPIARTQVEQRCPVCHAIVYSRRNRLCGVCTQPLPEEFLFTCSEANRIKALVEGERQRHRKWLAEYSHRSAAGF